MFKTFVVFIFKCRNEATRTPDPYVPNVVRYQLRYIPSLIIHWKQKSIQSVKICSISHCKPICFPCITLQK